MVNITRVPGELEIRNHHLSKFMGYREGEGLVEMWELIRPIWAQDKGDYSWFAVDGEGDRFRVSKAFTADGQKFWVISWIVGGIHHRVGSGLYNGETQAKLAAETLMTFP